MEKDDVMLLVAIILLLFTSLINWNVYSWLILLAIVLVFMGWYLRKYRE